MPARQRLVQICLSMVAAIALAGGTLQMVLGQTTPRLDSVHRFMAGMYLSMGVISPWACLTVRQQTTPVLPALMLWGQQGSRSGGAAGVAHA